MAKSNYSSVPSASLAKALSTVVRASGKDPYQMVHVQAENGKLSVRCFNGLMGILAIIAAEDKGNAFDATIDAQAFASLVGSMNGAVTLSPSGKNGLQVQSGSVDVTLKGINKTLAEFEDKDSKKVLTVNGQDLLDLLRVGSCAASDVILAYAAVLVNVSSGETSSWATDSFRAATCVKAIGGETANILLPLTVVNWMRAISPRAIVTIKSSEKRVTFEADDSGNVVKITSPVNDASKYPALSKVFDAMFAASGVKFTLDAATMSKAARQAKTLGADTVALHTETPSAKLMVRSPSSSIPSSWVRAWDSSQTAPRYFSSTPRNPYARRKAISASCSCRRTRPLKRRLRKRKLWKLRRWLWKSASPLQLKDKSCGSCSGFHP